MLLVAGLVLWNDLVRFEGPVGEKFVAVMQPGAADFSLAYLAARAYLAGENPYRNNVPEYADPWAREATIDGYRSGPFYPPTQFGQFIPLALVAGKDWHLAGRYWLRVNLLLVAALAVVSWMLLRDIVGRDSSPVVLIAFFAIALGLNVGTELGLERGQSDILTAFLGWSAVLAASRDRPAAAMFLAVAATLTKGYGLLFGAGIGVVLLNRRQWLAAVLGGCAAMLLLLAPFAHLLRFAIRNLGLRAAVTGGGWSDHSFLSLGASLAPAWAEHERKLLLGGALLMATVLFAVVWRVFRAEASRRERTTWLTLFATVSFGVMTSAPTCSYVYNLPLILPGALVIALAHRDIVEQLSLSRAAGHALGASLLVSAGLLAVVALKPSNVPLSSVGLVLFTLLSGCLAGRALSAPGARPALERAAVCEPSGESARRGRSRSGTS